MKPLIFQFYRLFAVQMEKKEELAKQAKIREMKQKAAASMKVKQGQQVKSTNKSSKSRRENSKSVRRERDPDYRRSSSRRHESGKGHFYTRTFRYLLTYSNKRKKCKLKRFQFCHAQCIVWYLDVSRDCSF